MEGWELSRLLLEEPARTTDCTRKACGWWERKQAGAAGGRQQGEGEGERWTQRGVWDRRVQGTRQASDGEGGVAGWVEHTGW